MLLKMIILNTCLARFKATSKLVFELLLETATAQLEVSIEDFDGKDEDEVGFHLQGLRWQQNGYDNQNEKDVYKFILLHNQI